MKIAILISGSPRFNKDLDTFINGLTGYTEADWYVALWANNPPPDKLGYPGHILVADNWRNVNSVWAESKIRSNFPENHKLAKLEVYNSDKIEYPVVTGPQVHHDNFPSIWKMHLGWYLVDQLRQRSGIAYDLVIRARPDIALPSNLDLADLKQQLVSNSKLVFVSNGGQHGYTHHINDIIAVSSPENMAVYTDLVNHSIEYNNKGVIFHPENLLAYHLDKKGLIVRPCVRAEIRLSSVVSGTEKFIADFGRWQ